MSDPWLEFVVREARDRGRTDLLIAADRRYDALVETLALAVPLRIWELRDRTPEQRSAIAKRCAQVVAERGDDLMFGSSRRGSAASAFNTLALGVAAAAYQPGGVKFAGRHWCTDHAACLAAEAAVPELPELPNEAVPAPEEPVQRAVETAALAGQWAGAL